MKRVCIVLVCFVCCACGFAQNADDPATKDDVVLLLKTMGSHDTMQRTMEAMLKPMHEMYHEQFLKDKEKLPPDFEARMNKMLDDMMKNMPFDEMMQAMVPVYQKHFTHGDVQAMNAFYSSPIGQKFLQEMPVVTGETMQTMVPIMTRYSQQWQERMQKEIENMETNSPAKPGTASQPQKSPQMQN
jgi:uncharacterized protein